MHNGQCFLSFDEIFERVRFRHFVSIFFAQQGAKVTFLLNDSRHTGQFLAAFPALFSLIVDGPDFSRFRDFDLPHNDLFRDLKYFI